MEIANMQLDYAENESVHKNQITALVPVNNTIDKHGVWNKIFQRSAKRTVDILGGLAGIIALIPITIGLFVAKLFSKDKGPLFYSQLRIGKNGKLVEYMEFDINVSIEKITTVLPQVMYAIVGVVLIFFVIVVMVPFIEVYMGNFLFDAYDV